MDQPRGHGDDAALVTEVVAITRALVEDLAAAGGTTPEVHAGSHLIADLELDSLGVVELAVRVAQATGRTIADDQLVELATVRDVADLVRAGPAGGAGGSAAGPVAAQRRAEAERQVEAGAAEVAHAELPTRPSRLGGVYALLVFGAVAVVTWPLLGVLPGIERRWRVVRAAGRVMLAGTGSRLEIVGLERLPQRPYVVVANHTSFLDPLLVAMTLPPPVVFTAVQGLAVNPVVRRFLAWMRCYLVLPGDRSRARRAVADLTHVVRSGWPVVLFPEGRRSERLGLEPFHLGAFRIAADAGAPVVPVAIRGARALLPVGRALPARGPVQLVVGAPLTATSADLAGAVDLRRRARDAILAELDEPDLA